jgi:hypothetical protein
MAIRINLLAEAQALEELRRRDPVKRLILVGALIGVGMLGWSSTLYFKATLLKTEVGRLEAELRQHTNDYQAVLNTQKKLNDVTDKLDALTCLATNRFLNGSMLDALQKTMIDDMQLMSLRTEYAYFLTEGTKAKTNSLGRVTSPAKPATVTEKIVLTLDAKDTSENPGDMVGKYKQSLGDSAYFRSALASSNDLNVKRYLPDPGSDGRAALNFTLECRFPEKTRSR